MMHLVVNSSGFRENVENTTLELMNGIRIFTCLNILPGRRQMIYSTVDIFKARTKPRIGVSDNQNMVVI